MFKVAGHKLQATLAIIAMRLSCSFLLVFSMLIILIFSLFSTFAVFKSGSAQEYVMLYFMTSGSGDTPRFRLGCGATALF